MTKGPGGRPPQNAVAKRAAISLRVTPSLREKSEFAAKAAGRSLTQEIEFRLEASFRDDARELLDPPGPRTVLFMRKLQAVISLIESWTGKNWADDGATSTVVKRAIDKLIGEGMPEDPEWVAAYQKMKDAPNDDEAQMAFSSINMRYDVFVNRALDAVTQRVWRNPGRVSKDGMVTRVADLARR